MCQNFRYINQKINLHTAFDVAHAIQSIAIILAGIHIRDVTEESENVTNQPVGGWAVTKYAGGGTALKVTRCTYTHRSSPYYSRSCSNRMEGWQSTQCSVFPSGYSADPTTVDGGRATAFCRNANSHHLAAHPHEHRLRRYQCAGRCAVAPLVRSQWTSLFACGVSAV